MADYHYYYYFRLGAPLYLTLFGSLTHLPDSVTILSGGWCLTNGSRISTRPVPKLLNGIKGEQFFFLRFGFVEK